MLAVGVSQSGETADTLAAMEMAKERGAKLFAICNVLGSQATRISDGVLYTHAGPEIGVASTKAFTTQLETFYLFALYLRQVRGLPVDRTLLDALAHLPQAIAEALKGEDQIAEIAKRLPPGQGLPLPGPRHQLSDRPRRRPQAQGDLLHPRRGLSRPAR